MGYENSLFNKIEGSQKSDIADALSPKTMSLRPAELNAAKVRLAKEYPEELETLEAFFGIAALLALQKKIETDGREKFRTMDEKERRQFFMNLTEYRFLITHFIIENNDKPETLEKFWQFALGVAQVTETPQIFERLKRSTLAQVAGFKILEAIGKKPKLATPEDDALKAIDIRIVGEETIQIAGTVRGRKLREARKVAIPALKIEGDADQFFSTNMGENTDILADIGKLPRKAKGYDMSIPYAEIDSITGKPSEGLINFFSRKLNDFEKGGSA